ncbi:hypothetical protein [Halomonas elongata]|uniref:Uncharacterized protein n=1 Tax=Halomonas elongata (strain ATCC 33173 / DSM 2581 / NBRC 15536 / NCIMB 2198 / 1H9) TaxID=768066 RepID=A0ABZ0TAD1_HALED|nr:hypothetical protein [Halomonas elongata]WBF19235.1 hypothetical protein LM502_05970 [Halomonas elongata]WPU48095.1 hypothetical protein SR933_04195 [Halomonas elongata DSM 2581]
MTNVTRIHPVVRHELDLPMEVLGVLYRQAEPTVHEIAHDIEMHHGYRMDGPAFIAALQHLRRLGHTIHEHDDPDGVRYEVVTGGSAA